MATDITSTVMIAGTIFVFIVFFILVANLSKGKKEGDQKMYEDEENTEPDTTCAFQCEYNDEDEEWNCALFGGNSDRYCDKDKCPFWKGA
jgi:Na+-transporting methylmalonyl-CoA/oxaloacetate decarboxylase gamma subunit